MNMLYSYLNLESTKTYVIGSTEQASCTVT